MSKEIKQYKHIIWKHSDDGMNVNCMSYKDFQKMCEVLVTPKEIVEYLKWRLKFYEDNRLEIQPFLERLDLTVQKAQNGEYKPTGSLWNILRKYVILFVSSGKIDKNLIVVKAPDFYYV